MRYAIALFLPCLFLSGPASAERLGSGLTKWNNDATLRSPHLGHFNRGYRRGRHTRPRHEDKSERKRSDDR